MTWIVNTANKKKQWNHKQRVIFKEASDDDEGEEAEEDHETNGNGVISSLYSVTL